MPRLSIIFGLPGSGKSTYIRENEDKYSGIKIEDYYKDSISGPPNRESRHYQELVEQLSSNSDCIIADIVFCIDERRKEFLGKILKEGIIDLEIEWIYFENDLESCLNNIERRNRTNFEHEKEKANELSQKFSAPINAKKKEVWKPEI